MINQLAIVLTLSFAPSLVLDTPEPAPNARPNFGMGMPQSTDGLPPFDQVAEGHEAVISSVDGQGGFYNLYRDENDHLLIEVAADYEKKPILIVEIASNHNESLNAILATEN